MSGGRVQEDTAHCCGGWDYDFRWSVTPWISKLDRVQYGNKEAMSVAF